MIMADPGVWAGVLVSGVFGAIVGSFLNVCIYRLPRGASIVWPASSCARCERPIAWFDNVPIVSYLLLGGHCRSCRERISIRYPIVEAITAVMFAGAWWLYGPSLLLVSRLILGCALVVLFAIDLEHQLLPNVITLPGVVVGFLLSFFTEPGWVGSLVGILLGGGVLFGTAELYYRIRDEEGLGMGDVKMLAMVGAFLGWQLTFMTLMLASVAGSVLGGALILFRQGGMKTALPFGTFLAVGAALAAAFGTPLLRWYLRLW
jgi:leader peptidase (prepilin peptidase)/N-methyltransferase